MFLQHTNILQCTTGCEAYAAATYASTQAELIAALSQYDDICIRITADIDLSGAFTGGSQWNAGSYGTDATQMHSGIGVFNGQKVRLYSDDNRVLSGQNATRVVYAEANSELTLDTLTLADGTPGGGQSNGGAVYHLGSLDAIDVAFKNNAVATSSDEEAPNFSGGAIFAKGALTLDGCTFTSNTASKSGGCVAVLTTATVSDSTFVSCTAEKGGAIASVEHWDSGTVWGAISSVAGSTFTSNSAGEGGAIFGLVSSITWSTFSANGNADDTNQGGAVYNKDAALSITNSVFDANIAGDNAGALYSDNAAVSLTGVTFTDNVNTAGEVVLTVASKAQNAPRAAQNGRCEPLKKRDSR